VKIHQKTLEPEKSQNQSF